MNSLLQKIPDSPVGARLRWYLEQLITAGENASLADHANYTPEVQKGMPLATTDEDLKTGWRGFSARLGELTELSIERADAFAIKVQIATAKGNKWALQFEVESEPPHRIARDEWQRQVDFKLEVRNATEADAAALAEIERNCPIVLDDTSIYFDRGDDYFAFFRLMEQAIVGIAFVDDKPAAVSCGALHRVRIDGVIHPIVTVVHLRVLPTHQRKGLWGAVNRALDPLFKQTKGSNAYIAVNNAGMQHGFANTPNKWPVVVNRVQLSCADIAGPPVGRAATPADAARIVEILNATHGQEEMYVPYTVESFSARLHRDPKLYSWNRFAMTDRAVVGVWTAGDALKVITETKAGRSVSQRALVLDYGFMPGGEDDLEALLKTQCAELARRNIDTLSIFVSESSPGCARICALGREVEPFNMWSPGLPASANSVKSGLYCDPVYF